MDDFEQPEQICLEGTLILADPSLIEPTFARTVLLLTNHAPDDGAAGFVLNRPLGKKVGDLVTGEDLDQLGNLPVYVGGPVSTEQLTFAAFAWNRKNSELDFSTHLSSDQAAHRLEEGFQVRAFVGYSGWSEGQLEDELKRQAWITKKPVEQLLGGPDGKELWVEMLKDMGPYYRLLSDTPEDPSLN
ncbi:MAG: YqgE/AlgH family protein [Verrucomicrobiota bacterium]